MPEDERTIKGANILHIMGWLMTRKKSLIASITAAVSISLVLGLVVLPRQSTDLPEPTSETDVAVDLGIVYLRVTPAISDYYDLGIDYGILVTEVTPDSPMDEASVQVGDVIYSYNGIKLDELDSPLRLMRTCRSGDKISLETCRNQDCSIVRLVYFCSGCGTDECTCGGPVSDEWELGYDMEG